MSRSNRTLSLHIQQRSKIKLNAICHLMFQKTRSQLTFAYLGVLTLILAVFTVAVRFTFTSSLNRQFNVRLENLAKAAAFNMDNDEGELEADEEEVLVNRQQIIEWFNLEGEVIAQQGEYELNLPLDTKYLEQIQNYPALLNCNDVQVFYRSIFNVKNT